MYLFRTYICMGCVMWADAGECFWKWEWISTYMHLCDAWESICINPQLYFFWKENICMGCVMWAARSQTPSFCSSSSPQTSKLPDWRTGLSSFTSKHVFLQTRRNYNFKWKFKKEKKTEVKAQHYNSFLFIKYICFVLVVEILIFNMFPAEVFFWDNSDLERKPNAIFLGGGAGLTIQQITSNIIDIYYLTNIRYIYIVTFFLSNFCVQYSVTEAS